MGTLLQLLGFVCGIGSLICFILVLIQMFQRGQTGLGIACIVLFFCCIGGLIAFVYGWMNAKAWDIQNIMMAWTACFIAGILINIITLAMGMQAIPWQQPAP